MSIKNLKNQSGVALILVLSAIVIITTMAAEFAYNTNVNYHLALNDRDRLKAHYLALSSYRFMLVELKFDKMFQRTVQQQNLGQFMGSEANIPLCQQFPISTQLIKAVFVESGEGGGEEGAEGGAEEGGEGGGSPIPAEFSKMISIEQREAAREFLNVDGDFDGECVDEGKKINLNAFALWKPDQPAATGLNDFDKFKAYLIQFLKNPAYEDAFEKAEVRPEDVVRNIADWVDTNERVNELGGVMGAPEDSMYTSKELAYPLKNFKFTTPQEVYLVEGVTDDWYAPLENRFTIYGDEKIDVCNADQDVVISLVRRYVETMEDPPAIDFNNPEVTDALGVAVSDGCAMGGVGNQLANNVSTAVDNKIKEFSGVAIEIQQPGTTPATTPSSSTPTGFGAFIATERRYFGLKMTGMSGDTAVTIRAVLDVKETDPKKWKLVYWQVR